MALALVFLRCRPETPSEVVRAAYEAANKGDYEKAEQQMTRFGKALLLQGGVNSRDRWDHLTRNRSIKEIVVVNETVLDDSATVTIKCYFADNSSLKQDESLKIEDGAWRLVGIEVHH